MRRLEVQNHRKPENKLHDTSLRTRGKLVGKDRLSLWAASKGVANLLGVSKRAEQTAQIVLATLQSALDGALSSGQMISEELQSNGHANRLSDAKIPLKYTYLVVDDDQPTADIIEKQLSLLGALRGKLLTANSGEAAIEAARAVEGPLVIFMDYGLPRINGGEASQEILKLRDKSDQQTIIIGISAYVGISSVGVDYGSGVYAVLPKEIIRDKQELAKIIDCAANAKPCPPIPHYQMLI